MIMTTQPKDTKDTKSYILLLTWNSPMGQLVHGECPVAEKVPGRHSGYTHAHTHTHTYIYIYI